MIDVSVIIPTYNRCMLLEKTLLSIMTQENNNLTYETIIVDDGSEDETRRLVENYKYKLDNLHYVYVKHKGYRVGYVRNQGLKKAKGSIIIFLDSGMVVNKNFIYQHYAAHAEKHIAVVGKIYGMSFVLEDKIFDTLINIENFNEIFDKVSKKNGFEDIRDNCLKYFDYDMNKMPAPYAFFWTGNVSVDRSDITAICGFDENMSGWGMEDVELGYRLYKRGVNYQYCSNAQALHIPHEKRDNCAETNNPDRDINNKKYFYKKHNNVDAELYFAACKDLNYNIFISQLWDNRKNRFDFSDLISERMHVPRLSNAVIFGAHNGAILDCFEQPTILEYDTLYADLLSKRGFNIYPSIGAFWPLGKTAFEYCILTDYWRFLCKQLLECVIHNGLEIAEKLYVLCRISYKGDNIMVSQYESLKLVNACLNIENAHSVERIQLCGDYVICWLECCKC